MDDADLQIENILDNHPKKKKRVDGKSKGDRTELNLCKMLTKHFGEEFSRALGSGSRWSQVGQLPEHAKKTLSGDICVPEGFRWVIECKGGYEDDINLTNVCDGKIARLDEFIEQVERDANYCGRLPIILWKRNRKPWLAIVRQQDLPIRFTHVHDLHGRMPDVNFVYYKDWFIVNFDKLLEISYEGYWFEITDNSN